MLHNPARLVRSAVDMSRMAVFTDGGRSVDRTNWPISYISYYPFGGAIALALDLTLRERSRNTITLDDYMRAMWRVHGKPGGARPGTVDRPYTLDDAMARLAEVSGDPAFARDFFARYVSGHEAADYERLLRLAGFVLRRANGGRASLGEIRLDERGSSVRVASPPFIGDPLYEAGLDLDDEIRELDGVTVRSYSDVARVLDRHRPGDRITIGFVNRLGRGIKQSLA
jgi:predicted metalloprotease with PDZ domain